MTVKVLKLCIAAAAATLVACGGGGGGDSAPAGPSAQVSFNEELAGFNLLNTERVRCGFGGLERNSQLDAAARAHADYQIANNVVSHEEEPGRPGFTGVGPLSRIRAQGYQEPVGGGIGVTDEIFVLLGSNAISGVAERGVRSLLNAPYHLQGLMSGYRDVGISLRPTTVISGPRAAVYLQINAAYKGGPQLLPATQVLSYPCEGSSGVDRQLSDEQPNPVPGRDLRTSPLGSSVYVAVREGQTLTINSASMVKVSNGQPVALRMPVTAANDPNPGFFRSHQGYVVPDGPLDANTAYRVRVGGANNGAPFSLNFIFTTGTGG